MANTKLITNQLPQIISKAMKSFTKNECYSVKHKTDTPNNKPLNCHYNVVEQIKLDGGVAVNGWLLSKNSKWKNTGVWYWSYHSIWKKNDAQLYDITIDSNNDIDDNSTVWIDERRTVDLNNGVSYNDIVLFENKTSANNFRAICESGKKEGQVYWTLTDGSRIRDINSYNGEYRFIRAEFPNNIEKLKTDFNLVIDNGKLKSLVGIDAVHPNFLFEFSVGTRRS